METGEKERERSTTEMNGRMVRLYRGDTYPAGAATLTLCEKQRVALQHGPRGGPVLPVREENNHLGQEILKRFKLNYT